MDAADLPLLYHIALVLAALWAAGAVGCRHSFLFLLAFLYLYMVLTLYRFHSFVSFFYFPTTTPTNRFSYCVSSLNASDMDHCFYLYSVFNHLSFC
jgi:hypothetical protein